MPSPQPRLISSTILTNLPVAGSRAAHRVDVRILRILFVVVLAYTAIQMALKAIG